jgi:thiredoxin
MYNSSQKLILDRNKMKKNLLIIALLSIFFAGCDNKNKDENNQTNSNSTKTLQSSIDYSVPFELTLMDDSKIKLQKFAKGFKVEGNNQAILFNFFATWCPPCKAEIPHLNNLNDKFKDKLKVISVLMEDKPKEEIEAFIKHFKVKFDVTYGESNFFFAKALGGVVGIPYMVLYKPNGEYVTHYVGMVPEEMLESDINKVIE